MTREYFEMMRPAVWESGAAGTPCQQSSHFCVLRQCALTSAGYHVLHSIQPLPSFRITAQLLINTRRTHRGINTGMEVHLICISGIRDHFGRTIHERHSAQQAPGNARVESTGVKQRHAGVGAPRLLVNGRRGHVAAVHGRDRPPRLVRGQVGVFPGDGLG